MIKNLPRKRKYCISNNSHKTIEFKSPQIRFDSEQDSDSYITTEKLIANMFEHNLVINENKSLIADGVIIRVTKGGTIYNKDITIDRIVLVNIESDPCWKVKVKCDSLCIKMAPI